MIDLRSDTVTRPSKEMLDAMYNAEVGDDVFKEDPTINALEKYTAELLGKESALFVSSGTMANQLCLNVHTEPGDEVLCEKDAHIFHYESGAPSVLSGIQLTPIEGKSGVVSAEQYEKYIRPVESYYMPKTKVIEIENTHNRAGGTIHPLENMSEVKKVADNYGLKMHLDGARLCNASVETGITLEDYAKYFNSVSICLSKGLGAPVGSVIAGTKNFIDQAFIVRKRWGGGMRQAGVLAAAGLYALKNNFQRLKVDHEKIRILAKFLIKYDNVNIDMDTVQTNMLIFEVSGKTADEFAAECEAEGLRIIPMGKYKLRAVAHLDVSFEQIETAKNILAKVLEN